MSTSIAQVTLTFTVPEEVLATYDDLARQDEGITVESVAASLCHDHEPADGYIHFTVKRKGGA